MKIILHRNNSKPLYQQITEQIKNQILAGQLPSGYRLPPERKLAESLGVNRTTILNAYRELKSEGFLASHVGQGTIVLSMGENSIEEYQMVSEPIWNHYFSQYSGRFNDYEMNHLLSLANKKDIISFATGISSPACAPKHILAEVKAELDKNGIDESLIHSPVEGFMSLRIALKDYMVQRGSPCLPEEVMVVAGSQQGIDLAGRALIDSGDIIFIEEPTFFPAIQVFKAASAKIIGIPMEPDGMNIDVLEQLLKRYHPKLIYTIPSFHNPTGIEMSLEKRKRLINLASKYRVLILEDDAYGELCYGGNSLPTLKSLDRAGFVIYLNTFSKVLYPGLRVGWLVAKEPVIRRFSAVRQICDLHTSCLSQQIAQRFIESAGYEEHLQMICEEYQNRQKLMVAALKKYAVAGMTFHTPRGGYYIWCALPKGVASAKVLERAANYGVVFITGQTFYIDKQNDGYMRLNFTFADKEHIESGIKILCRAVREQMKQLDTQDESVFVEMNPIV